MRRGADTLDALHEAFARSFTLPVLRVCTMILVGLSVLAWVAQLAGREPEVQMSLWGLTLAYPVMLLLLLARATLERGAVEVAPISVGVRCVITAGLLYLVGSVVLQAIRTYPLQSGVLLIVVMICTLAMRGTVIRIKAPVRRDPRGRRRSDTSEEIISVHEAGHALMYACADRNPSLRVVMADPRILRGTYGMVSSDLNDTDTHMSHDQVCWRMFTYLAGRAAEQLIFGRISIGSHSDMIQYDQLVAEYFVTLGDPMMRGFVFAGTAPHDNPRRISEVREAQHRALQTFMSANRDLLLEVAQRLKQKRKLYADDLYPLLARVQLTPDLPILPGAVGQMEHVEHVPA